MVFRLLAVPGVALLTLALAPLPPAGRPAQPPVAAAAAGERPSPTEWESLLTTDPVAALRAARDRYAAEATGVRMVMHKQERLGGTLQPPEVVDVLVRETPYAVRMIWRSGSRRVLGTAVEGTLYAAGENGGRMTVWRPTALASFLRYYDLSPTDAPARSASRYSLTEAGLGHTLSRTLAAWGHARDRDTIAYLGCRPVPDLAGRACHVLRRTCTPPEGDRFLTADPDPSGDPFATATIYLDPETWVQVGAELRRADGELVGRYLFRDVQLNSTFTANDFTRDALTK